MITCVEKLNNVISNDESLGDGFCIGHSYFCNLSSDTITNHTLSGIVEYELIPLLKEYWFDEPTKVKDWSDNLRSILQFPRRMLVDVKKAIESENHSLLDKLVPPYPVNVTAQMLDCFSEKYDLPEKKVTDVDELPIGYIAEELWIYSKSVELLTEPEDACYLAAQTQDIQLNITEMLCLLKNKLPVKDVDWLIEICDNVFSGEKFDDIMFNNVIEHFIQKKIEQ